MTGSLLEMLPGIVAAGRRAAAQAERRVGAGALRTRELVSPRPGEDGGGWRNRLIHGDNLLAMAALLAEDGGLRGKIDLIYVDPPYDSRTDYRTRISLPGATVQQRPTVIEHVAYSDTWTDGTASYLAMLVPRMILMRELLSPTGSFFLHLDWHVAHYAKIVADELFGREQFRNEIVWCYSGGGIPARQLPRKHDVIFWYTRGGVWTFHPQYRPYSEGTVNRGRTAVKGPGAELRAEGTPINDWWPDVKKITSPTDPEKLYYATQKSEELLSRIIGMCSDPGDLVADFFAGSGTTAAAAERLGRRWVVGDLGGPAVMITRRRLVTQRATPFLYQAIGPEVRSAGGRRLRANVAFRKAVDDGEELGVELVGYVPRPPASIALDERDGAALRRVMADEPLALIEHWAVDADYDGVLFRASWQDYRGGAGRPRVVTSARLRLPRNDGVRRVCVRAVDVFGYESEVVLDSVRPEP